MFGRVRFSYGSGVEAVLKSVCLGWDGPEQSARSQQLKLPRVGRDFNDVGCPAEAARAEKFLQRGQCAANNFLGRVYDHLNGSPVCHRAADIPHGNAV